MRCIFLFIVLLLITCVVIIIIRAENESYDTYRNEYRIETMTDEIIVVSTPYLSGYRVTRTIGFTWGLIVRSRAQEETSLQDYEPSLAGKFTKPQEREYPRPMTEQI